MNAFDNHKDHIIRLLLWLLMLISLIASMRHVAWLFSTIELMHYASGWVAAMGFDFGIFLLTLLAHRYKEGSAQRRFIRVGIYANALLSAIANVMYGVEHQVELERVQGWLWLLIPYVFALALPMMVVFFAEVLSREEENESKNFEREQKKLTRQTVTQSVTAVSHIVAASDTEQNHLVLDAVTQNVTSHRKIADMTGLDRGRVARAIDRLVTAGAVKKDSRGRITSAERDNLVTAEN